MATVNGLAQQPDFIVFTGDLTHTTDDGKERRERMKRFKRDRLGARASRTCASCRASTTPRSTRARPSRSSSAPRTTPSTTRACISSPSTTSPIPAAKLGDEQLAWLAADLKQRKTDDRIVVLTHRPLFDLEPEWDWTTADGAKAIELLMPYQNVVVFYGHIHQEHHHMTGHIAHHAAKSLIFPLPAPGSQPKRPPLRLRRRRAGSRHARRGRGQQGRRFIELPVTKG